jgi:hypothetical protein
MKYEVYIENELRRKVVRQMFIFIIVIWLLMIIPRIGGIEIK